MTIQLTAPIRIAGVDQAIGTSLTLGADMEAELVNRGVAVFTSRTLTPGENLTPAMVSIDANGNTVLLAEDGTVLLTIDSNGNLIANVNHRTGSLATLLALAGGDGEISAATDVEALVRHNGVAGGAVEYRRSRDHLALVASRTMAIATGTDTVLTGWTELLDTVAAFNPTTGEYTVPTGYTALSINAVVDWVDLAIGTANARKVIVQIEAVPGVWVDYFAAVSRVSTASTRTVMNYTLPFADITSSAGKKLRMVLRHEAGSSLSPVVNIDARLMK